MSESLITPAPRPALAHWAFTPPALVIPSPTRSKVRVRKTVKQVKFVAPTDMGRVYAFPAPVRETPKLPVPQVKRGLTRRRPAIVTVVLTEQSDDAALAHLAMTL